MSYKQNNYDVYDNNNNSDNSSKFVFPVRALISRKACDGRPAAYAMVRDPTLGNPCNASNSKIISVGMV